MGGSRRALLAVLSVLVVATLIGLWHHRGRSPARRGVRLTSELAEAWAAASRADDVAAALKRAGSGSFGPNLADPQAVRSAGRNPDVDRAVRAHGFRSGEQWAEVTVKMVAVSLADALPAMQAKSEGAAQGNEELGAAMDKAFTETGAWVEATVAAMSKDEVDAARRANQAASQPLSAVR